MSQLSTTCDVTNGSQTITFPSGTDLSNIVVGSIVLVGGDNTPYYIALINNNGDTVSITEEYAGSTVSTGSGTGTSISINTSFTLQNGIPYPEISDTRNISILKSAILRIQKLFSMFPFTGDDFIAATSTTYGNRAGGLYYDKIPGSKTVETTSTTYIKVAEMTMQRSGTVYVYLSANGSATYATYARIYKNGSPYGTERITNTSSIYYETLSFSKGDLFQLYLKTENAATIRCNALTSFFVTNEDYHMDSLTYRRSYD